MSQLYLYYYGIYVLTKIISYTYHIILKEYIFLKSLTQFVDDNDIIHGNIGRCVLSD